MGLFDFLKTSSGFTQPDWRASAEECLEGDQGACEFVSITAPNLPANFVGTARKLTAGAHDRAAATLGVSVAAVKAVCEVEALGSGFLPTGKPKILFESHLFGRLTNGKYHRTHPNISTPKWDKTTYGKGGEHQYARLKIAYGLNPVAALKSASWGSFQILGSNHASCGLPTVEAFVMAQCQGEDEQVQMFANFVVASKSMHAALKRRDWAGFAKLYNGPGYAANKYDTKMAAAYRKHGGR